MKRETTSDLNVVALGISICLHAAVLAFLPRLDYTPEMPPLSMEVEFAQMAEAHEESPPPAPPPPEVQPRKPSPAQPTKPVPAPKVSAAPVLAAEESVAAPAPYEVPAAPVSPPAESAPPDTAPVAQAETSPAAASPVSSEPRNVVRLDTPEAAGKDEAWKGYGQLLHDMVGRNKQYPQIAIRRSLQGTATVSARFSMGRVVDISLVDSSGHKILDEQALKMVRKAVEELPVKDSLARKTFAVVVPVDFRLEG